MEKNEEVQDKINDLEYETEKQLDDEENRRGIKNLIGVAITIACAIGMIALLSAHLPVCLVMGLGLLGGLTAVKSKCNNELSKSRIEKYNQELEHLERVEEDGIANSKELTEKRKIRLTELAEQQPELEKKANGSEDLSTIAAIISIIGAAGTAFLTPWIAIPTVVAELISFSTAIDAIEENEKLQNINNRIDNLKNDLEVTHTMDEVKEKEAARKAKSAPSSTLKPLVAAKKKTPEESAVDKYVEGLAENHEDSKPKTLAKNI